jgi:hypothetical protein
MKMHEPTHYRAQAARFVEQAQDAKSPQHRLLLLRKAETMVRMAEQARLMERIVQDQDAVATMAPRPLAAS